MDYDISPLAIIKVSSLFLVSERESVSPTCINRTKIYLLFSAVNNRRKEIGGKLSYINLTTEVIKIITKIEPNG